MRVSHLDEYPSLDKIKYIIGYRAAKIILIFIMYFMISLSGGIESIYGIIITVLEKIMNLLKYPGVILGVLISKLINDMTIIEMARICNSLRK